MHIRVYLFDKRMSPYFDILAVDSDLIYERRGRIQREGGIHPQWFHHPDAIRVPESVFSDFSSAFRDSHPAFNYYGPTEYSDQEITRLCHELTFGVRYDKSVCSRAEMKDAISKIIALAKHALANGQSLLVLGI